MTPNKIRRIARQVGGQCALARLIGRDPRNVRRWCAGATEPGPEALAALELIETSAKDGAGKKALAP